MGPKENQLYGKKLSCYILLKEITFSNHIFLLLMQILSIILVKRANINLQRVFLFFFHHMTSVCCLCKDPAAVVRVLFGKLFKDPAEFESGRHL